MCILLNGADLQKKKVFVTQFKRVSTTTTIYLEREVQMSVVWPNEHSLLTSDRDELSDS